MRQTRAMKVLASLLSMVVGSFFETVAVSIAATPIQKVLQLMDRMKDKCISEMKEEQVLFSAFVQFCADKEATNRQIIKNSDSRVEKLAASIEMVRVDMEDAQKLVVELEEDLARWKRDGGAATDIRQKESADFKATYEDYTRTLDACDRAIVSLGKLPNKVPQSVLQVHHVVFKEAMRTPSQTRRAISNLLEEVSSKQDPRLLRNPPKTYAYESEIHDVVDMIKDVRLRFVDEQRDLEREEMGARHSYESLMQRLKDEEELAKQTIGQKMEQINHLGAQKVADEGEKAEQERVQAEAETYLHALLELRAEKQKDFDSRQKLRADEIEALTQAIGIISSDSVAAERLPGASFFAVGPGVGAQVLVQLQGVPGRSLELKRVAAFLRQRAKALGSQELSMLARNAQDDPFAKVKKMIRDLISHLLEQASDEANHKAWCDAELATNRLTRTNKAEAIDQLSAEVERLTVVNAQLAQAVEELSEEIASLDSSVAEVSAQRQEERAKNEEVIADARESQTAVAQALAVLRDFYARAAEATALQQQAPAEEAPAEEAPQTFTSPYRGLQGESKGVLGMLEVIEADFARLQVTVDAEERSAEEAFRAFVAEARKDKEVAEVESDHKMAKMETNRQLLKSTQHSVEETQAELNTATAYYEKLKPDCVDFGIDWDERIRRRQKEIQSLKEAYQILSGEEVPTFQAMKAEQMAAV